MTYKTITRVTLVFGVLLAASSQAQTHINFTGELDLLVSHTQAAGADSDNTLALESNGMTTSWLGVHASHVINDDITLIAAVESFFRPDSGDEGRFANDNFFARSAYIGLKGDFGRLTLGRNASPYFLSTILFNPFGDSFAFSPMVLLSYGGGGLYGDTGWSNSLVYTTPELGGFTSSLAYAMGEQQGETGTHKVTANTFYKAGSFGLTAALQKISGPQPGAWTLGEDESQSAALVGLSYDIGKSTVFAQYQSLSDELSGGDIDRDSLVLSAAIAAGPGALYLSYGYSDISTELIDRKRHIYTLVYNLPLGPKGDIYAGVCSDDPDAVEQQGRTLGVGGRFRF